MSAFGIGELAFGVSNGAELTWSDRLAAIDKAYATDRAECANLIDGLYAHFDAHDAG